MGDNSESSPFRARRTSVPPETDAMAGKAPAATQPYRDVNRARFETDLEFIQCLANPFYLQTLAQQAVLSDPSFLAYLSYLEYFRQPSFSKFLHYPQCLHHLELLNKSSAFREAIKHDATVAELAKSQVEHWRTWREQLEGVGGGAAATGDESGSAELAKDDVKEMET